MRKKLGLAALAVVGFLLISVPVARAQGFRSGPNASIAADETIDGTLFTAGSTVDIAGTVQGDVFCAGQNITVSGTVRGDVICAGQNVTISGTVEGDIRAAGQTVTISGAVAGNISTAGQSVTITNNGKVAGDVTAAGNDVSIAGTVGRDIIMGGVNITLSNSVGRNVYGEVESLRLDGNANIGGKLDYTSQKTASIDQAAVVSGGVSHSIPPTPRRSPARQANLFFAIFMTASLLATALVLILLAPQFVDSMAVHTMKKPLKAFGVGVLFLFVAPVAIVGLMLTVVGVPLGLLMILGSLLVLMLCGPVFAYLLGRLLWRSQDNAVLIMLVGSLLLLISYFLPVVQVIGMLAALTIGSGMVILAIARRLGKPSYRVAPHKAE